MIAQSGNSFAPLLGLLAVALIVLMIDFGLFIAWAITKEAVDAGEREPIFARRWSLVDVWFGGQIALVLTATASFLVIIAVLPIWGFSGLSSMAEMKGPALPFFLLGSLVSQNAAFVLTPIAFILWKYRLPLSTIGLKWLPSGHDLAIGAGAGFAMLVLAVILENVMKVGIALVFGAAALHRLEELTAKLTIEGMFAHGISPVMFVVFLIAAAIAAPIGEEVFFRGFLYNAAKTRFGVGWGVAISSTVFALVHFGPLAVIAIVFIGAMLAIMYERTGSLWVTITMHGVFNGTQVALVYFLQGLTKH